MDTPTEIDEAGPGHPDRRRALRQPICIPTHVDTTTRPKRFAVTQNVSQTGALLVTPSRFRIGEQATLRFRAPNTGDYTEVKGRIVRLEINPHDGVGIWPFLAAVSFVTPLESYLD